MNLSKQTLIVLLLLLLTTVACGFKDTIKADLTHGAAKGSVDARRSDPTATPAPTSTPASEPFASPSALPDPSEGPITLPKKTSPPGEEACEEDRECVLQLVGNQGGDKSAFKYVPRLYYCPPNADCIEPLRFADGYVAYCSEHVCKAAPVSVASNSRCTGTKPAGEVECLNLRCNNEADRYEWTTPDEAVDALNACRPCPNC